jgi:hypothetical protein
MNGHSRIMVGRSIFILGAVKSMSRERKREMARETATVIGDNGMMTMAMCALDSMCLDNAMSRGECRSSSVWNVVI